jgi:multiple sugar transport system permease protein/cellobiose transport system permease protein
MSTLPNGSLFSTMPMIPGGYLITNLKTLFFRINVVRNFLNSCLVSVTSTAMNLFFSSLASYAFSKHRFRFKETLFMIVLVTMFVPSQLAFIGFVQEMKAFGLFNSLLALILPSFGSAFAIFIIRAYISEAVPDSLVDAATIDGCPDFSIYLRIVLPIIKPVIASVGILTFMGTWNNYTGPLVVLNKPALFTLPLAIASLAGLFNNNYSVICIGILISTLPILIVYACLSRLFITALTAGALKE